MKPFTPARAMLTLCCVAAMAMPAHAREVAFDAAMQLYEDNHWTEAFVSFARMADAGDAEAARIATMMWRHGYRLYGQRFDPEAGQVERWQVVRIAAIGPRED